MNVLVDTSVWSLALRRRRPRQHDAVAELRELVREGRVVIIGPIRQELLSGIRARADFEALRDDLRAFSDMAVTREDYERAAECFNECWAAGVQGSNTDFLLCAVAERHSLPILTTDRDFASYAGILPIHLHQPRSSFERN
jgi:predicted nucleic acid-binding protein